MQIVGNSVYSAGYSPSSQQATSDARVEQRRAEESQQRNAVSEEQKRKQLQSSNEPPAGVSRDQDLGFRQVTATNGANKQYAVYAEGDRESTLPNSQRKALQAYTETENISRVDANIEYLGSVDIFV